MAVDRSFAALIGVEAPVLQAPMAGAGFADLAAAVSEAGGLGSLGAATLSLARLRDEVAAIRSRTVRPLNLNFFCHQPPAVEPEALANWRRRLAPYYVERGLDPAMDLPAATRAPFDASTCALVEALRPEVVSFHFGLPAADLLARVKATGAKVLSTATSVAEAVWLQEAGCDAIIAQGVEAGGHRGMFLTDDLATQTGTLALVPQVVDAVRAPVIAAGGIADARGVRAAFALGAAAVQIGTAYLLCPEAEITDVHRAALRRSGDGETAVTNLFTGRPARGVVNRLMRELGPVGDAPSFPLAAAAIVPLRAAAEAAGSDDFTPLWSGQAARLAPLLPAAELTRYFAEAARSVS